MHKFDRCISVHLILMQNCVCRHMGTAKTQISLCTHAASAGPSLSANRIIGYYRMDENLHMSRVDRKTVASQMVVFPNT